MADKQDITAQRGSNEATDSTKSGKDTIIVASWKNQTRQGEVATYVEGLIDASDFMVRTGSRLAKISHNDFIQVGDSWGVPLSIQTDAVKTFGQAWEEYSSAPDNYALTKSNKARFLAQAGATEESQAD
ncbi:hypothetical protein I204_07390 [Kwoniella mangroviensis CBS 8886]|nr:hypothetical protein I204_07390 [Kwoniella mangroviensis CBS 8886]